MYEYRAISDGARRNSVLGSVFTALAGLVFRFKQKVEETHPHGSRQFEAVVTSVQSHTYGPVGISGITDRAPGGKLEITGASLWRGMRPGGPLASSYKNLMLDSLSALLHAMLLASTHI